MSDNGHDAAYNPEGLISPEQVLREFGVKRTAVARWSASGYLTYITTPTGDRMYRRDEVAVLVAQEKRAARERQRWADGYDQ
jgi:predicted site-specific integrase-resolvase